MDWSGLVVGAVLGAIVGIVIQSMMFPSLESHFRERRARARYRATNEAWGAIERLHPRLVLVQAGWGPDGFFPAGTVTLRLGEPFVLDARLSRGLRQPHADRWSEEGFTDGEQVGTSAFTIIRTSDVGGDELDARSHHLQLKVHSYQYFDFLATHRLRLEGTDAERLVLDDVVGIPNPQSPVVGFPNPCSVGLSMFCESGGQLVLSRRSTNSASGGHWEGGKVYNAVGEGAALRDFHVALDGSQQSTPEVIAKRGIYEELGLAPEEIEACVLKIHSFAWATDLLDHKFFGVAISPLSSSEVQARWTAATDRSEADGALLDIRPARSREDCRAILSTIRGNPEDWAPEATFSTVRSLLCLGRIGERDLLHVFGRPRGR